MLGLSGFKGLDNKPVNQGYPYQESRPVRDFGKKPVLILVARLAGWQTVPLSDQTLHQFRAFANPGRVGGSRERAGNRGWQTG